MMSSHKNQFSLFCLFVVLLLSGQSGICLQRDQQLNEFHPTKLFVFGDSYVDTGNIGDGMEPYGITFPGYPDGRASDGRVLTDYIAKYLGLKSPIPYRYLSKLMTRSLEYGMNFAFDGSGVFDTSNPVPNMTIQIDFFEKVIKDKVYNASDLSNSVAYVSVAGNDYFHYFATNRSIAAFPFFLIEVVHQALINMDRIQKLGVKKIVVGGLQPLGCLPIITAPSSFQQCNSTVNELVAAHNELLNQGVSELNQQSTDNTTFLILDLYDSFTSVLNHSSTYNIHDPLTPCCVGVRSGYYCGSVDENTGEKLYKVCDKPKSAFFWDVLHPTQAGWHAVYNKLQTMSALHQLFY